MTTDDVFICVTTQAREWVPASERPTRICLQKRFVRVESIRGVSCDIDGGNVALITDEGRTYSIEESLEEFQNRMREALAARRA